MNTLKPTSGRCVAAALLFVATPYAGSAANAPHPAQGAHPAGGASVAASEGSGTSASSTQISNAAGTREAKVTFAELGFDAIALRGVQASAVLNLGVRRDEVVAGAVMHLRLTYSPSLLADLSHVRVVLNGQATAALPLLKADAGHEITRTIDLDPRYFSDYNQIRLDLVGHYTLGCQDPDDPAIWATVGGQSDITLTLRPIELRDDLGALPAPFFDVHDNRRLELPIVLPAGASRDIVRSAGVAASWFGMLADYRSARFPVSFDTLPSSHGLVFATNAAHPAALNLPQVQTPTLSIVDHPLNPSVKLLVFQGKDEPQLRQAVEALVLGNAVLTGSSATIAKVSYGRRVLYDAPRWVRTDRPVKLAELIDSADQLQTHGIAPPAMNINLRLPPDLFTWNRVGVPVDLRYRYTAPAERDNSVLTVTINGLLLRSYRLPPESQAGSAGRFFVPLLQNDGSRETHGLLIPAFQLASDNQMQFQFSMDFHRESECKEVFVDNTRESIDPDSTIDISSFPHYAALPNLALFANAGFPFTRYADLADTAVVLPDGADRAALEQLFFLLGRMGRQTGAATLGYRLLDAHEAESAKDVDLLVLSGPASNGLLEHWGRDLALVFGKLGRDYRQLATAPSPITGTTRVDVPDGASPNVVVQTNGSLGALMGFESRVSSGRTVVALAGTDAAAAGSLITALEDPAKVPLIRGELAIVREDTVQSFQGSDTYFVGSLSWWQWLWFHFSQHAWILVLVSIATAVALGLFVYGRLQRVVTRRLQGRSGT